MIKPIEQSVFEALLKSKYTHLLNDEIVITCADDRYLRVHMSGADFNYIYLILIQSHSDVKIRISIYIDGPELKILLDGNSKFFINYLMRKANEATMLKLK